MYKLLLIGWITIRSSVGGANVMIDEYDGIPIQGKQICLSVDSGHHLLMVDKEGYRPYIDTITVQQGVNHVVEVWLEPQTAGTQKKTSAFQRQTWDYEATNGKNNIRWIGIGGAIGTGIDLHLSLFEMRFGLFGLDPCLWGINLPFFSNVSHAQPKWQIHPRDRRSESTLYEVAIPTSDFQIYYTPMLGVYFPVWNQIAITLSAGPQISWTRIRWSEQLRDLPRTYAYQFTNDPFPTSGMYFDPVWFSVQAGMLFTGTRSDLLAYLKYQDGYVIGLEIRF